MNDALYYPWIDVHDEAWLKSSVLYWDSVRTIVPESIAKPYESDAGRALQDAGFLVPLRVMSQMPEVEELADDVLTYLTSEEGVELLLESGDGCRHYIHPEKLPYMLRELEGMSRLHPEKLPYEIQDALRRIGMHQDGDWFRVDGVFAKYYMTLLATRLAGRLGHALVTELPAADRLAVAARLDGQLQGLVRWRSGSRPWREYQALGHRQDIPRHLAPGLLAHLAIARVGISPDTPIDDLIAFKDRHRDELSLFRNAIRSLASSVESDDSVEAVRARVQSLYDDQVRPAISNLQKALDGRRIKWMSEGLLKVAFLSAGPSCMLVAAGMAVPTALLVGAGVSLVASGIMYNVDREHLLAASPFAYLVSMQRALG